MPIIHEEKIVPYSAEQIFELVNNVEDYSNFLPLCYKSQVIHQSAENMHAILGFEWKGIRQNFSTNNIIHANKSIEMNLEDGPLDKLVGTWKFIHIEEKSSKVVLDLEFFVKNKIMNSFLNKFVTKLASNFINGFTNRAKDIYG